MLGIEVPDDLVESWARWLAPDPQPFLVGADGWADVAGEAGRVTPELRDTFRLWGVAPGSRLLWLSEAAFASLDARDRRALVREQVVRRRGAVPTVRAWRDVLDPTELRRHGDGHRFVWWRSLVDTDPVGILRRVVSDRRLASRHAEVAAATWRACDQVLPAARGLAGTFPDGSTTCCFGTVMAAAGADDTAACDSVEPFSAWLEATCRPGGDPARPGTVLVWRDMTGSPVHAAVSIGDGWALEKPSQEWHSPRGVAAVRDVVRLARLAGQHLERHTIVP